MPRGDGTGPAGMGPMTGRAAGYCAGHAAPGFADPVPGRGTRFGMGRGLGRGLGRGFRGGRGGRWAAPQGVPVPSGYPAPYVPPVPTAEQQLEGLRAQAEHLENALDSIKERVSELEVPETEK